MKDAKHGRRAHASATRDGDAGAVSSGAHSRPLLWFTADATQYGKRAYSPLCDALRGCSAAGW